MLAALTTRVRLSAVVSTGLRGGRGEVVIGFLCVRIRLPLRIHGLEPPQLSVEILNHDGGRRVILTLAHKTRGANTWIQAIWRALRVERLVLTATIGVAGCPAETALLCGALESVAREALPLLHDCRRADISVAPAWSQTVFRLNLEGIVSARAVQIMKERISLRGESSYGTSVGKHSAACRCGVKESC